MPTEACTVGKQAVHILLECFLVTTRNEVAARQYFHKCVSRILSIGGIHGTGVCAWHGGACIAGGMHGRGACMAGGMHGKGCAWQGGACVAGGVHGTGACMTRDMCDGGHAWQGACMAGETAIAVGSMHPTGMHSCYFYCPQ